MSMTTTIKNAIPWLGGIRRKSAIQDERYYRATQWQLVWWKFRKHRLARLSLVVLGLLYLIAIFCEFVSPHEPEHRYQDHISTPPMALRIYDPATGFHPPFVYGLKRGRNPVTFRMEYQEDTSKIVPVKLLTRGNAYQLWGVIPSDVHLFGTENGTPVILLGTDKLGRDLLSRILYGSRISLTVGLIGVFFSFIIGLLLGGISGYFGGTIDEIIQRSIDLLTSLPTIPLWLCLAAALPQNWTNLQTYFLITIILSIIGWTGLARVVRGKILSLREEDYTLAARLDGANEWRIITTHLLPSFASYIIVSLTLAIPGMIIGETSLSFLGLGLRPPTISWGVLLQDAQNVMAIAQTPWLMWPAAFVILAILMFNFLGDGLRDAADPYSS